MGCQLIYRLRRRRVSCSLIDADEGPHLTSSLIAGRNSRRQVDGLMREYRDDARSGAKVMIFDGRSIHSRLCRHAEAYDYDEMGYMRDGEIVLFSARAAR